MRLLLFFLLLLPAARIAAQEEPDTRYDDVQRDTLQRILTARRSVGDSLLASYYYNDTSGFVSYPPKSLLDSIVPSPLVLDWELDLGNHIDTGIVYSCLYRSGTGAVAYKQTTGVRATPRNGFGPSCRPGECFWYFHVRLRNGKEAVINNNLGLKAFVGKIDNAWDAWLWLHGWSYTSNRGMPTGTAWGARYKQVKDGYLVLVPSTINDCPVTTAHLLYFVGYDRRITFIRVMLVEVSRACV